MRAVEMFAIRKECESAGLPDDLIRDIIRARMAVKAAPKRRVPSPESVARKAAREAATEARNVARAIEQARKNRAHQARIDLVLSGSARPMVANNWLDEMPGPR